MNIDRLETHDRLEHLKQDQGLNIFQGAEDCFKKNSLSLAIQAHSPYFYIFAHPRLSDCGTYHRMLWQPRLTRPKPQTNSYLFRALSNTDEIEVCWMIPPKETWEQYKKGNVTEHELVLWSIDQFTNHFDELNASHSEDFPDKKIRDIYKAIGKDAQMKKFKNKIIR